MRSPEHSLDRDSGVAYSPNGTVHEPALYIEGEYGIRIENVLELNPYRE